jgi:hypothetical protein
MAVACLVSCGSSSSSGSGTSTSKLKFRAFVSNPLQVTSLGPTPVLNIVDASKDRVSPYTVSLSSLLSSGTSDPGIMVLSPDKKYTLVVSSTDNTVVLVDNATEAIASNGTTSIPAIKLPDFTESALVAPFSSLGYAAVRNAPVQGGQPGLVEVLNLTNGSIAAGIPVPGVHYVVQAHNGNKVLALSDTSNTITVISPSLIGGATDPRTYSSGFDRPVWAVFSSDDSKAYVFNCGPQCGGIGPSASIAVLNMNTLAIDATIPVRGATYGILSGNTLYTAGTPAGTACPSGTAAASCGTLDIVDVTTQTVTPAAIITDGYHNRMDLGSNGRLFIGSRDCSEINIPASGNNPGELRGCLSIYNTANSNVVFPSDSGDVTGIQPITGRNVVYVCQGGELRIYDTTTDKLLVLTNVPDIIGQAVDVKLID